MNDVTPSKGQKLRWQASLLLVSSILGVMVTIQYTGVHRAKPQLASDSLELKTQMLAELDYSQTLKKQILDLQNQINQYKTSAGDTESLRNQLSGELYKVRLEAGMTPLTGPGLTITVTRRNDLYDKAILAGMTPDDLQLDQAFMREFTALLFASGAQGVSINNYRIAAFSTISAIGANDNQLQVNGRAVADPFVFKVVGKAEDLNAALVNNRLPDIFKQKAYDMQVIPATTQNPITLPPYNENEIEIRDAKVDTQGVKP